MEKLVKNCKGFDWDKGNSQKNWIKHKVSQVECEQIFFNKPIILADDLKHSQIEKRWFVLGKTDLDRLLFVVFAIRKNKIRIISARNMNKKERKIYSEQI